MKKPITIIATVLLLGAATVYFFIRTSQISPTGDSPADSATYKQYAALTGETYDRLFLAGMISHHQGAVEMAKLALTRAKHLELKNLANSIIAAQNKEISDMTAWQRQWGYPATSSENMMDHSAMGMDNDMSQMTSKLKDLSGDAFDKTFLELMIAHHQSAIDMARPGPTNAQHEEVKALTRTIMSDQSREIDQMQTWQGDWGYKKVPSIR